MVVETNGDRSAPLPSPSLSPITASQKAMEPSEDDISMDTSHNSLLLASPTSTSRELRTLLDLPNMVDTFDGLPSNLQSYIMFQLLKRCPTSTLQFVSSVVTPSLRKDFLRQLPYELSLNVLKFLDVKSLCRAAQVSKRWRLLVDSDPHVWKNKFDEDGYVYEEDEERRASKEHWNTYGYIPRGRRRRGLRSHRVDRWAMEGSSVEDMAQEATDEIWRSRLSESEEKRNSKRKGKQSMEVPIRDDYMRENSTSSETSTDSTYEPHADDVDGDDDDDAMSEPVCAYHEDVEMEGNASIRTSTPLTTLDTSASHPHKAIYRRHKLIADNWVHGQARHIRFRGHGAAVVTCLQFDADKIVSGSDDKSMNVYDTETGKLRCKLEGHDGGVWALEYIGNMLVSGATDRTVRIWDIERGLCTHVLQGHTGTVRCLQIVKPTHEPGSKGLKPVSPMVVTGSRDATLRVWKLPSLDELAEVQSTIIYSSHHDEQEEDYEKRGVLQHVLMGHTSAVRSLSAHGSTLVSGGYDHTVRVWDVVTGESKWVLTGHREKVYSVVYDPDIAGGGSQRRCMSGSMDASVRVWNLEDGSCIWSLEGHSSLVGLLGLDGNKLVSAAADWTLRVWDATTGHCSQVLAGHDGAITCFQHDQTKCISGSDGALKMWDLTQSHGQGDLRGMPVRDLVDGLSGVWQCRFDERRCVAAVQRGNSTWFEVLDFGVVGIEEPPSSESSGESSLSSNDEEIGEERGEADEAEMAETLGNIQAPVVNRNLQRLVEEREAMGTPLSDGGIGIGNVAGMPATAVSTGMTQHVPLTHPVPQTMTQLSQFLEQMGGPLQGQPSSQGQSSSRGSRRTRRDNNEWRHM